MSLVATYGQATPDEGAGPPIHTTWQRAGTARADEGRQHAAAFQTRTCRPGATSTSSSFSVGTG